MLLDPDCHHPSFLEWLADCFDPQQVQQVQQV